MRKNKRSKTELRPKSEPNKIRSTQRSKPRRMKKRRKSREVKVWKEAFMAVKRLPPLTLP